MLIVIVSLIAFAAAVMMIAKFYSLMSCIDEHLQKQLDEFLNIYQPELKNMHAMVFEYFDETVGQCHYRQDELLREITSETKKIHQALSEIRVIADQRQELEKEIQKFKAIAARKEKKNG